MVSTDGWMMALLKIYLQSPYQKTNARRTAIGYPNGTSMLPMRSQGYHLTCLDEKYRNLNAGFTTNQKKSSSTRPLVYALARMPNNLQLNPCNASGIMRSRGYMTQKSQK